MKKIFSIRTIILAGSLLLQLSTLCFHSRGAPGDVDLSFDPGSGVNGLVNAVAVQPDGKVIIGGEFTTVRGLARTKIARLNADGSGDSSFNPGASLAELSNSDWMISAVALQSDGKVIIGGAFIVGGLNGIVRLNADGTLDSSFNSTDVQATVSSIVLQPDGKVLIGGGVVVGGTNLTGIVRLNGNGGFDSSFNPSAGGYGSVLSLALQPDGKVLVGGNSFIRRLNANGSLDGSFNPGTGPNSGVRSVAVQSDGKVLIGGWFSSVNGTNRGGIARLNANGSLDNSFNPSTGVNSDVRSVALQSDGKVLIGGFFTNVNGANRNNIARLNANGSLDSSFNSGTGANGGVYSVVVQSNGKVLAGGYFTAVNGTNRYRMARLNADGGLDDGFDPGTGVDSSISSLALQPDGRVLISRSTIYYNGPPGIGRLNPDGSGDASFNPPAGFWCNALALQPDGKVVTAPMMVRFNANGGQDNGFQTGFGVDHAAGCGGPPYQCYSNYYATAVAAQSDGKLLVGVASTYYWDCGGEGCAGQLTSYFVTRRNADGSGDTNFNGAGAGGPVSSIAVQSDGKVLIGGWFSSVNGTNRNGIARLNANGSLDNSFNSGTEVNSDVRTVALQSDGKVLIGGWFGSVNGTNHTTAIARLNANGSLDSTFNPGTGASWVVRSLALQSDGKVLIGGDFTTVNGTNRNGIARLNANGSLDSTFNPGTGADDVVHSIALQSDGNVLIGGDFLTVNGVVRPHVARLYGDSVAPSLNITRSSSSVILAWPVSALNFQLQASTNLALPSSWSAVAQPAVTNAGQISVAVPTTVGRKFFRLRSQ